jgi:hypothetical protein
MDPIEIPEGREVFRLFWDGIVNGAREVLVNVSEAISWILQALARWLS